MQDAPAWAPDMGGGVKMGIALQSILDLSIEIHGSFKPMTENPLVTEWVRWEGFRLFESAKNLNPYNGQF